MKGIYYIKNTVNGKIYIGKSININRRLITHKHLLNKDVRKKDVNRHLYNAVKHYGWDEFETGVLEECEDLVEAELRWMDTFESYNRDYGYNLRRDSSSQSIVHNETRALQSANNSGTNNPNYNNKWSDDSKVRMSEIKKRQHADGLYNDEWKSKISAASTRLWQDDTKKAAMAIKVSKSKEKYRFHQYDKQMNHVATWDSVKDIIAAYPDYKWQNIYSVCNGYKPTYKGFIWRKELKI